MTPFLTAVQFLTRLPVYSRTAPSPQTVARSLVYYPLVGFVLGLLLAALHVLLGDAPHLVRAALVLAAWVTLTGGLHLDGLADTADAWAGAHGDRERALAIMKDPRSGPFAVVALVLVLLLKFAALGSIASSAWLVLACVPALARGGIPLLFATTPYVRPGGLGEALAAAPRGAGFAAAAAAGLAVFALLGATALWLVAAWSVVFVTARATMRHAFGGVTGDTAGAFIELAETAMLLTLVTGEAFLV